jgi:hypothetical protein
VKVVVERPVKQYPPSLIKYEKEKPGSGTHSGCVHRVRRPQMPSQSSALTLTARGCLIEKKQKEGQSFLRGYRELWRTLKVWRITVMVYRTFILSHGVVLR